jgi:hypothetical protein
MFLTLILKEFHCRTGGVAQVVEHLPSKNKALRTIPTTTANQSVNQQTIELHGIRSVFHLWMNGQHVLPNVNTAPGLMCLSSAFIVPVRWVPRCGIAECRSWCLARL